MLALNVGVFVLWQLALAWGPEAQAFMAANFLTSVEHLRAGFVWTLLTSEISHVNLAHLGFNLFAIWMFGRELEQLLGWRAFLHLYVAGAIVASLGHVLYGAVTGVAAPALGASGAAMAILMVSALLFPNRRLLLFFVIPVPALAAVGLFALIDVIGLVNPGDRIAHAAHLGGALYGLVYYRYRLGDYLRARLGRVGVVQMTDGGRGSSGAWM